MKCGHYDYMLKQSLGSFDERMQKLSAPKKPNAIVDAVALVGVIVLVYAIPFAAQFLDQMVA